MLNCHLECHLLSLGHAVEALSPSLHFFLGVSNLSSLKAGRPEAFANGTIKRKAVGQVFSRPRWSRCPLIREWSKDTPTLAGSTTGMQSPEAIAEEAPEAAVIAEALPIYMRFLFVHSPVCLCFFFTKEGAERGLFQALLKKKKLGLWWDREKSGDNGVVWGRQNTSKRL